MIVSNFERLKVAPRVKRGLLDVDRNRPQQKPAIHNRNIV